MGWLDDGFPLRDLVDHSWNETLDGIGVVFVNRLEFVEIFESNYSHIHLTYRLNFVYQFLSLGMELAVIKELFIILHIYYLYFLTNLFWFFYIYLFID